MENHSTFLSEEKVRNVVHIAAEEIRTFLAFVNDPKGDSPYSSVTDKKAYLSGLSENMLQSAKSFQEDPESFSDEAMLKMGEGLQEAIRNFVRIEIRRADGVDGAAQIVAKGIEGEFRETALSRFRSMDGFAKDDLTVKFAGKSSIEFNIAAVNKALPFKYLEYHFAQVLEQMEYTPAELIDATKSSTMIAADGDSTMYGGPTLTHLPTLQESPAQEALNEFLDLGGVFMIISGNNLERTEMRIRDGIKDKYKHRCILVGNGAASMAIFGRDGHLKEIEDYRLNALKYKDEAKISGILDVIYIGNDGHPHGNDIEGFKEVGFGRSFLVEKEDAPIEEHLREHFIPGEEKATGNLLSIINEEIKRKQKAPFFDEATITAILKRIKK